MKTTKKIISLICVLMIAIGALTLTGCGKKDDPNANTLIGSWEYTGPSSTRYVYTFNEDKTGIYSVYGTDMKFTYEDDGSSVTILYDGNIIKNKFEYRIEGNKLIIKDSFGKDVEYSRK